MKLINMMIPIRMDSKITNIALEKDIVRVYANCILHYHTKITFYFYISDYEKYGCYNIFCYIIYYFGGYNYENHWYSKRIFY